MSVRQFRVWLVVRGSKPDDPGSQIRPAMPLLLRPSTALNVSLVSMFHAFMLSSSARWWARTRARWPRWWRRTWSSWRCGPRRPRSTGGRGKWQLRGSVRLVLMQGLWSASCHRIAPPLCPWRLAATVCTRVTGAGQPLLVNNPSPQPSHSSRPTQQAVRHGP